MKPDELLSDLTPCTTDASFLVAAARQHARHRRQLQIGSAAAALILATVVALRLLPTGETATPPEEAAVTPPSPMLTKQELLDSFGDQPVALITWPDGRQKLLAINRPAPARRRVTPR